MPLNVISNISNIKFITAGKREGEDSPIVALSA